MIDTDVQAYDAALASIAGLTTAADKMIYTTASDTYAVTDLTSAGRDLLDDADTAAQRTTLGLVIDTDVQAYDADLAAVAGLSTTGLMARTGSGTAATRTITAGTGISISNGDGVSGDPTISAAVAALTTASGSAPSYSARSWVNFGGATPTIAASGNVSSITDIATGRFGVNFTTAMPNSNYATTGAGRRLDAVNDCNFSLNQAGATYSTSRVDVAFTDSSNGVLLDPSIGCVVTFV